MNSNEFLFNQYDRLPTEAHQYELILLAVRHAIARPIEIPNRPRSIRKVDSPRRVRKLPLQFDNGTANFIDAPALGGRTS